MTTVQDWIDRTRQYLLGGPIGERNQLASPYVAGSGTMAFKYALGGITKGARLSSGLNTLYVWDAQAAGVTATVSGGDAGSTDANLTAGATVWVRPLFTDAEIWNALAEEVQALSSPQNGLFQVKTFDLTYNSSIDGYDLAGVTNLQAIYEVRYQEPGPYKGWPRLHAHEWRLDRNAYVPDFPSGNAIKVMRGGWPGYDVRIVYAAPYAPFANLTDDVIGVCGVSATALDIPPIGAAVRLMAGREIKRNVTEGQPDTRRATEVPPGAVLNSSRGLMMLRQQRIAEEAARIHTQYPYLRAI